MLRRNLAVLLCAGLAMVLLCGLGVWQVQRLQWKNDLIAKLNARLLQAPVPLAEALTRAKAGEDVEYLRVAFSGSADGKPIYKQATLQGLAAWEGLVPFQAEDGSRVILDMGASASRPDGVSPQTHALQGILRWHDKGRGFFDPVNDVTGNHWFWWDVAAMQAASGIAGPAQPIVQLTGPNPAAAFTSAEPKVELANNHLGYAITWFGLAAALAGVAGAFVFGRKEV